MLMGNDCHDCGKHNRLEMIKIFLRGLKILLMKIIAVSKKKNGKVNITVMLCMITSHSVPTDLR